MRKPRSRSATLNEIVYEYIFRANRDGKAWRLGKKFALSLVVKDCHYCKRTPYQTHRGHAYMGIDRVDNSRGYYKDNVLPCCKECNSIKGQYLSQEEMEVIAPIILAIRRIKRAG